MNKTRTAAKWFAGMAVVTALFASTAGPALAADSGWNGTVASNRDSGWNGTVATK
jgi:hypothetical protein